MKNIWLLISIVSAFLVSACNSPSADSLKPTIQEPNALVAPTANADVSDSLLDTTLGDFIVVSARLVNEAHEYMAPAGYKFLLIGLAQPDSKKLVAGEFS